MLLTINPQIMLKWLTCFFRDQLHCQGLESESVKDGDVQKCREAVLFCELQSSYGVFVHMYIYIKPRLGFRIWYQNGVIITCRRMTKVGILAAFQIYLTFQLSFLYLKVKFQLSEICLEFFFLKKKKTILLYK